MNTHRLIVLRFPLVALGALLVALAVGSAAAASPTYADPGGACAGLTPCYTTIQEAVDNAGPAPAEVFVFPGSYDETVDLSDMGSAIAGAPGDITLTTVDAAGTPTPGTATVAPAIGDGFRTFAGNFPGDVTLDGFVVLSVDVDGISIEVDGNAVIANVTADGNSSGNGVDVFSTGNVTVTDSVANGNGDEGFDLTASGDLTISGSSADGNEDSGFNGHATNTHVSDSDADDNGFDGFNLDDSVDSSSGTIEITNSHASGNSVAIDGDDNFDLDAGGTVTISDSSALGNLDDDGIDINAGGDITITNTTSNDNVDEGMELDTDANVILDGVTANGNGDDGVDVEEFQELAQDITVSNSLFQDNTGAGVDIDKDFHFEEAVYSVTGSILCGNGQAGLEQNSAILTDATADWWGAASGPTHLNNPSGTGDAVIDGGNPAGPEEPGLGAADFDPWIDTASGTGGAATVGLPVVVAFEFTGGAGAVAFQAGPGDPNGDPTFAATTDNGTVSSSGFASGGTLEVTLTPDTAGPATVTVTGPCGLDETLGGNSVTLDVAAAPVGPTPTPAQLPETGGTPASGAGVPWLALLVAGVALAGAGGALVAVRRRR